MGKISQWSSRAPRIPAGADSLPLVFGILIALAMAACSQGEDADSLESRAHRINQTVMCPVCPGESIDQSQNPLAERMRGIVLDRLEQGWTEQQIKDHFVESYGDSVLLSPPARGFSLLIWILPPVGLAAAAAAAAFAIRSMRRGREPAEVLTGTELSDNEYRRYAERIDRILEEPDPGQGTERGA